MQRHLHCYRSRPDVLAICHARPATAKGLAAAGRALEDPIFPEIIVCFRTFPFALCGVPGTLELCTGLEFLATKHDAILHENHGVVTCEQDLVASYQRMHAWKW